MRLLALLFILFVATILGALFHKDPGGFVLYYGQWVIEMPLWLLIAICFGTLLALWILVSIVRYILNIANSITNWRNKRGKSKSI